MRKHAHAVLVTVLLSLALLAGQSFAGGNERGLDRANLDTTVSPCTDFYEYVNGGWLKNNTIPPEYSSWGIGREMQQRNYDQLKAILESAATATNAPKGSNLQKIGDFYASAMDTATIDAQGLKPLQKYFDQIAAITGPKDIAKVIDNLHVAGYQVVFGAGALQDLKNSSQIIVYCTEGGLGLPDRDYYLKTSEESQKLRDQYVEHVGKMFELMGDKPGDAAAEAKAIMNLESKLAEVTLTNVEARDPKNLYNPITVIEADKLTPNFSWTAYFKAIGHPAVNSFSYAHPKFFGRMDSLMTQLPIADWKNYLRWSVINSAAPYLGSKFEKQDFYFYSTVLAGTKELRPRWKRVLDQVNGAMGEALGQLYVEKAFPPKSKARAMDMIQNMIVAFKTRINNLTWMSDATKKMAIAKLSAFTPKIGYPDKWRDYSALTIDRGPYVDNVFRAQAFEFQRQLNKIGKPVDKTEWNMPPQIINAYYNPLQNEIVFPAAILQPPLFDGEMDDAVNYGAMGAVIGHEMTHGFDNHGCEFDAQGNMKNWWTDADKAEFDKRTQKLVKQFDDYVAIDSLHINGKLTLGENIGDLGGLLIAYDALQLALNGKDRKLIDGFTPEQRFFLSWAQAWRTKMRPEALKLQVNTNEHSPGQFRGFAPLTNMPAFCKAFGCKPGDAMARDEKDLVQIW